MQAVAERVGVRPPSLYKRVRDRDALLAARGPGDRWTTSAQRLEASDGSLAGLARAYRAFAHEHPEGVPADVRRRGRGRVAASA